MNKAKYRNCPRHEFCKGIISVDVKARYCTKCQEQLIKMIEKYPSLEWFSDRDLCFIFEHPTGCLAKELQAYLGMPTSTFNCLNRKGKIKIERTWRVGKEVHKQIGFSEIARVLSRMHNWVSIYQVAITNNKHYSTLRCYASGKFFGPIKENFEGLLSIHIRYLEDFDKRYARAKDSCNESKRVGKRNLLKEGEIHLGIAAAWIGNKESNLWRYYDQGYLLGCSRNGMTVIRVEDFKAFLLNVAAGKIPVVCSILGSWADSPLAKDKRFVAKMNRRLSREVMRTYSAFGQKLRVLKEGELGVANICNITGAARPAVNRWFREGRINSIYEGGVYSTTWPEFKEFLIAVRNRSVKVKTVNMEKALAHPQIASDEQFIAKILGPKG